MVYELETKDEQAILKIDGKITVSEAGFLRDILIECFDGYNGLTLDLQEVDECDAAGIQLICSVHKTAIAKEKPFSVANASKALTETVVRAGLNPEKLLNI
ncbi:MAG: STAS domain-containing protein [Desulfobacterales bacterium]|nr:STAS domain-containing protein [Desulfobacterales bacterium]